MTIVPIIIQNTNLQPISNHPDLMKSILGTAFPITEISSINGKCLACTTVLNVVKRMQMSNHTLNDVASGLAHR